MKTATLFLIPNLISDTEINSVIPIIIKDKVIDLKFFIVENIREARRYLKKLNNEIDINSITFFELNQHTKENEISDFLYEAEKGNNFGLISDAGLPCIADPGNVIVKLAHEKNIKVVPLVGPSSIFLALMASGLNGQNFAFNGYIPIEKNDRIKKIKLLEQKSVKEKQSQIFMDTPYRNNKLLADLINTLNFDTLLCIAFDISGENEFIVTRHIFEWKKNKPDLNKKPCIFIV
jgi:16S rRNA (cytidine1402-2'-O)-methyltransferase